MNWGDKAESRTAIKGILKEFLGEDVVFNLGENSAIAYLTSKGLDHTLAGDNTAEKAAALSSFYRLISNAEYSYSGRQDQHSKTIGREDWDYFVSVAEIEGGGTVPLVFAVRSIDQDVRSQIYSIATKKNPTIPRGDGTQGNPANAHPSYGDLSSSNGIVEQNDPKVKSQFSLSEADQAYTEDIAPVRDDVNIQKSLSKQGKDDEIAPVGGYRVYGKDIMLDEGDIAPIARWDAETEEITFPLPPGVEETAKTAKVLVHEGDEKKSFGDKLRGAWEDTKKTANTIMTNFADKGWVFENLSKKTGNRELEAKYNFMHYSESRAQQYIKEHLIPLREAVMKTGKAKEVYE